MLVLPGLNGAPDQIILTTNSRVQRSTDGGANVGAGRPLARQTDAALLGENDEPVRSTSWGDSSAPEHLYALTANASLWLSENGGLSWHSAELDRVSTIAITPHFGMYAWAATADRLAQSTDDGASWAMRPLPRSSAAGRSDNLSGRIVALRGDPRVPETLYAALQGGEVYRTDDAGATWVFLGHAGQQRGDRIGTGSGLAWAALRLHR